ncbi:MAG TPA: glycosyl transferase [Geobacter sp.]|nr:glycosyl transferase [Geobacter sp.]
MTDAVIDVIIPIWNRPDETRNCLVNLIGHTPGARFIMVDCGSERDTERLLQEFADGLDDRALLMRDDSNIGFVRSANRGFESSRAPYLALVRNTTVVSAGWLDPILAFARQHPEAGILLPSLEPGAPCAAATEVEHGSFAAMVLTRELYRGIGGFDEGMDGGAWCLKDYTRRACAKGFLTYHVHTPVVSWQDETPFGSEQRRRETLHRSITMFRERWGNGGDYILHVPKGVEVDLLGQKLEWLVKGARLGDSYTLLLPCALSRAAQQAGFDALHENVRMVSLPRLGWDGMKRRVFDKIVSDKKGIVPVTAVDGLPFPWSDRYLSFSDLTERIRERCQGRGNL